MVKHLGLMSNLSERPQVHYRSHPEHSPRGGRKKPVTICSSDVSGDTRGTPKKVDEDIPDKREAGNPEHQRHRLLVPGQELVGRHDFHGMSPQRRVRWMMMFFTVHFLSWLNEVRTTVKLHSTVSPSDSDLRSSDAPVPPALVPLEPSRPGLADPRLPSRNGSLAGFMRR